MLNILLVAGLVLGALVAARLIAVLRRLSSLHEAIAGVPVVPPASARPLISIEILNPFELAVEETALAGPAAKLAPRIIERIVYRRTREILVEQLKERGVRAQVNVHDS